MSGAGEEGRAEGAEGGEEVLETGVPSPERIVYGKHERFGLNRFSEEELIVGAILRGKFEARDHDNRDALGLGLGAEFLVHVFAAQSRQSEIEHNGVRALAPFYGFKRPHTVINGRCLEASATQRVQKEGSSGFVVFNDENGRQRHGRLG